MRFYEVSPIGIISKDFETMTYSHGESLKLGQVVEIPVGSRKLVGVVIRKVIRPQFETKEITNVLFNAPLPASLVSLHSWISQFYTTHPGTVWQTLLPSGLSKKRRPIVVKNTLSNVNREVNRTNIVFTADQVSAIDQIIKAGIGTSVLHGITGSGKTEVYKALASEAQTRNKSSIILVPEISLTAQFVNEFQNDFENVVVTHSAMTESERTNIWRQILESTEPQIIIGPRSALFMPVQNLGLIVVDECHEPSYIQEKSPRYNTLRVASVLARETASRLVLGSATPSITDYYTAKHLNRPIIEMKNLAREGASKPSLNIVDLTQRDNQSVESRVFSRQLLESIKKTLLNKQQVLLFHNRRGTASVTLCNNCGWMATCPHCFLPMTLHADKHELRCHICGFRDKILTKCPNCQNADIVHKGIGTKRIEEEVRRLFPAASIRRFDGDTVRGQAVQDVFDKLHSGEVDIIIGTQTIAKGLDLPKLSLVGIVQADVGLNLPDFSSNERTFQLISQATGRVGRTDKDTSVIIQTYQPNAPAVQFGAMQNYKDFYQYEIQNRARGRFPPFAHLLKLTCIYKTEKGASNAAIKLASIIKADHPEVKILGPTPAFYERIRSTYRWQIIVRSNNRAELIEITKKVPPTKWQVELDPVSLI